MTSTKTRPHPFENADPELIFVHAQPMPPLTPEEQLFFVSGQWGFFNPHTHTDDLFDSKEEALAAVLQSDKAMLQPLQRAEDDFLVLIDQVIALVEEIKADEAELQAA